jgi:excinuclease UvrABC nuclease subunit
MHRCININLVTKIEYAVFPTEADMNLYEIYFINKLKPPLNVDDKTRDELTVTLPDVEFKVFECHLWDKWKAEIFINNGEYSSKRARYRAIQEEYRILRSKFKLKEITESQYDELHDALEKEESELKKYYYG